MDEDVSLIIENQEDQKNKLYSNNEKIKKIEFRCYVNNIFSTQFEGCYNLEIVEFRKNVGVIETNAFTSCNIKKIFFYEHVDLIQKGAFLDNPIKEVFFKADTQIEERAFSETDASFSFLLLEGVSYPKLKLYALKNNIHIKIIPAQKVEKIQVSSNIKNETLIISSANEIKDRLYSNREDLKALIFTCYIDKIFQGQFEGCYNLETVIFKQDVREIGVDAFSDCNIKELIFEKNVYIIKSGAFQGNPLVELSFNNDVQIAKRAFLNCGNYSDNLCIKINDASFHNIITFAKSNSINIIFPEPSPWKNNSNIKGLKVSASNISVSIKSIFGFRKKTILSNISLDFNPGEMIMIIGSSGTGKTTLIKNLLGYENSIGSGGKVWLTNTKTIHHVKENLMSKKIRKKYQKNFYYAPQFSISNEELTIEQEIQKCALLYSGKRLDDEQLKCICKKFNLWDDEKKLLKVKVKMISGGQKKKLLMACANCTEPDLYVFDEPDSGLDEPSSFNLFIKDLSEEVVQKKGKTVIVVSHHPHNYMTLFDNQNGDTQKRFDHIFNKLIVLAKKNNSEGSSIAYCGNPQKARQFFGLSNNDPYSKIINVITPIDEGGKGKGQWYIEKWEKEKVK